MRRRYGRKKTFRGRRRVRGKRRSFKRFGNRRGSKRAMRTARRVNTRTGVYSCKLRAQEEAVSSTGGQTAAPTASLSPVSTASGAARAEWLSQWVCRAVDLQGFNSMATVFRKFRIRGFKLLFRPNWKQNDLSNNTGLAAPTRAMSQVPLFRYTVNADPGSVPDGATTGGNLFLTAMHNSRTHDFSGGRPLSIYCRWPKIPEYIPFVGFKQGFDEGEQWLDNPGFEDLIFASGRVRWFPTSQGAAINAEHMGILVGFDDPWYYDPAVVTNTATLPRIEVSMVAYVDFKEHCPGYETFF